MAKFGLIAHGGHCCGVTHLYLGGLTALNHQLAAQPKFDYRRLHETGEARCGYVPSGRGVDAAGRDLGDATAIYTWSSPLPADKSYPSQTAAERADELLYDYMTLLRSAGVIEVAITDQQTGAWNDFLVERGFKGVGSSRNSNTRKIIHMYMLFYDGKDGLPKKILEVGEKRKAAAAEAKAAKAAAAEAKAAKAA